jgi:hypothetical protein
MVIAMGQLDGNVAVITGGTEGALRAVDLRLLAMTASFGPTMTGRFLAIVATLDGFGGCDGTAGAGRVAAGGEA